MPLLSGDIRFARSANMADVPEGGGPPSAQLLTSGRSNEIFPDISEETRTVGRVEIYQIFSVLRNADSSPLLGANVIVAEPPADPNVSVVMLSLKDPFATRADIARRIESSMSPGSEWAGYLLEDHYETMRSVTLLQRPGMQPPTLGRTFVLVYDEGLPTERRQRVRIKATETQTRIYTEIVNNQLIDFEAQVTTCELFDGLLFDFPGSPPTRSYARQDDKTVLRETVYSDSGMFYSATRLTAPTQASDVWLQCASIYAQLVPNSRTEVAAVDQRPSARRTLVLAEAPRRVEVGITPHTQRIKIAEENADLTFVAQLRALPEPGMVFIDYYALGTRYTIYDDGTGRLVGSGGGAVSTLTGAMSFTLKALPDIGSSIGITHGSRVAYTDRSSQGAAVRAPEYCFLLADEGVVPGSLTFTWLSGGILRTAPADAAGQISGDGTGSVDHPSNTVLLRPSYMPDPGAEIQVAYTVDQVHTEVLTAPEPDAGGFVQLALAQQPAAGTLAVSWATVHPFSPALGVSTTTTPPAVIGADITANIVPAVDRVLSVLPVPQFWFPPLWIAPPPVIWPRSD